MARLTTIDNAAILITGGKIDKIAPMSEINSENYSGTHRILDAEGRVSLPGFVDSHTHLIFGGYRPDEFEWRLKGDSYMSIMERGGGIQSTVNATRVESAEDLRRKALWFIDRMVDMGVTTVEAKSGYGLDTESEMKMLDVIESIASDEKTPL